MNLEKELNEFVNEILNLNELRAQPTSGQARELVAAEIFNEKYWKYFRSGATQPIDSSKLSPGEKSMVQQIKTYLNANPKVAEQINKEDKPSYDIYFPPGGRGIAHIYAEGVNSQSGRPIASIKVKSK
jgi:hypothetical protein